MRKTGFPFKSPHCSVCQYLVKCLYFGDVKTADSDVAVCEKELNCAKNLYHFGSTERLNSHF